MTKAKTTRPAKQTKAQRERSARRQRERLARAARIDRERGDMALKPWQLAPSEVDDGPSPWPRGSSGYASWFVAQAQRAEILARDPNYFAGE
jgi:hypothetical protein